MSKDKFWEYKTLNQMSRSEWESLCDGCGRCCLNKLENEDTQELFFTDVACKLLDLSSCQCSDYPNRKQWVPDCIDLSQMPQGQFSWLPSTCAYRLISERKPLKDWHPLNTGDRQSTFNAGMSVKGKVVHENRYNVKKLESHIIAWVN